jgi:membrane-associated phospholipid phosphatase
VPISLADIPFALESAKILRRVQTLVVLPRLLLNLRRFVINSIFMLAALLICIRWVDRAVATLLARNMPEVIASHAKDVPDLLLPFTLVISGASWAGYIWLTSKKSDSPLRYVLATIAVASVLSFAGKSLLQFLFGRFSPIQSLDWPDRPQFQFFGAKGAACSFPSGHMSVFTPVLIALYRIFPSMRAWLIGFWVALALALIAGNYHFVSDIIAGAYLGFVIDCLALYLAFRFVRHAEQFETTPSPES